MPRARVFDARHRIAAALAAGILVAVSVGVARADEYGTYQNGAGPLPDSNLHTYCLTPQIITANLDEVAVWAMNNSLAPTDMNVPAGELRANHDGHLVL